MDVQKTLPSLANEVRSLQKHDVLWAIAIILGLTSAPLVTGFTASWMY